MPKLPWTPLIILAGVSALLFRRSPPAKSSSTGGGRPARPSTSGVEYTADRPPVSQFVPTPSTSVTGPVPGSPCPTLDGQLAVYGPDGECRVFWRYDQDSYALREKITEAWHAQGRPNLCDGTPSALDYPGTQLEQWTVNPVTLSIAHDALVSLYPQQPVNLWPPREDSHHWVNSVWAIAVHAVGSELCGWELVT